MKPAVCKNFMSIAIAVIFAFVSGSVRGAAVDSASGFDIWVTVEELTGQESGYASVKLTLDIPAGTPLLARESAIDSAMAALRDIWNVRSFHQDVRGFLGSEIPYDIQQSVSTISGTSFILAITDAFNAVEDAGYSRFQCDVSISIAEKITLPYPSTTPTARTPYPDAPRNFQWIVSGPSAMNPRNSETWVIASLVNFSASVLSFRSEFGRFPSSLAELDERGHLLIEPINPYTNIPVQQANTAVPGDINYEYIDANTVSLITYIVVNGQLDVVRREINLYSSSSAFDLLYRETTGLTENEKIVARYIFQISQIINEYYYQFHKLPYSVPQCESEGFAYVSFINPYTGQDVAQTISLVSAFPGDYRYNRVSQTEYFLAGYGENGRLILSVGKNFSATNETAAGQLRIR